MLLIEKSRTTFMLAADFTASDENAKKMAYDIRPAGRFYFRKSLTVLNFVFSLVSALCRHKLLKVERIFCVNIQPLPLPGHFSRRGAL